MKYIICFFLISITAISCKPKVLSGRVLENKLKETMAMHLNKTPHPDVQFTVKNVSYFPEADKKDYICQFEVNMHYKNKDTAGMMKAVISNDFKNVKRIP